MRKFPVVVAVSILAALPAAAKPAAANLADPGELVVYEQPNFRGEYYVVDADRVTMRTNWNIRSISIYAGEKWHICAKPRYRDPCLDLTESLPDSSVYGINGQIGSARRIAPQ